MALPSGSGWQAPPLGTPHLAALKCFARLPQTTACMHSSVQVLTYSSVLMAVGVAGRLGATPLSIFILARTVTNITGISLTNGLSAGVVLHWRG